MSRQSRQEKKQAKPIVKVPRGKVGRMVFAGSQVAGAVSAVRTMRDARNKDDKLALLHGALSAAVLVVTVLIAVRTMRSSDAEPIDESAERAVLAAANR